MLATGVKRTASAICITTRKIDHFKSIRGGLVALACEVNIATTFTKTSQPKRAYQVGVDIWRHKEGLWTATLVISNFFGSE